MDPARNDPRCHHCGPWVQQSGVPFDRRRRRHAAGPNMSVTRIVQRSIAMCAVLAFACAAAPSAAAVWGPEARITNATGHSLAPRLAAYNGALHAVWFDYINAGSDAE